MRNFLIYAIALLGLTHLGAAAGEVSASLDRQTIFEGEGVRLNVMFEGNPGGVEPDFSVLAEDFHLGGTASTSQSSFVGNQRRETSTHWSIELEPRSPGEIAIPPIPVGSFRTEPLTLTVMPRSDSGPGGEEIFMQAEVSTPRPYVHAQVLLTVKIYHLHPFTEGRLGEPRLSNAVVERLGEDRAYPATIDGRRYRVLERRFAVFPERSGAMIIEPIGFRGRVADRDSRFNSLFDPGRRVNVSTEAITLDVQPQPASYPDGPWLPALGVEIEETWPEGGAEFVVGQPATRRIEMRAKGLLSVQLPEIAVPDLPALKVYPDQANSQSRTDGTWVIGQREQSYALVPTEAGAMTLPEIRLPWWDTEADELREAVIPAREIIVRPGTVPTATPAVPVASTEGPRGAAPAGVGPWRWVAIAALGLWLATLVAWGLERRARPRRGRSKSAGPPSENAWRSRLKDACRRNDATLAAAALLGWARAVYGTPVRSVGALAGRVADDSFAAAIRQLDRALYAGPEDESWDGESLWIHARVGLDTRASAPDDRPSLLPPLYPEKEMS